jgi:hypothetical protein
MRLSGSEWWSIVEAEFGSTGRDLLLRLERINLLPVFEHIVLAGRDVDGFGIWLLAGQV